MSGQQPWDKLPLEYLDFFLGCAAIGEKIMRTMKLIAGAAFAVSAVAGVNAASAADMAPRMYTKAP
ncbi:MAG: hypothetical protein WB420_13485, partial [Bradyrhizobium sp.]